MRIGKKAAAWAAALIVLAGALVYFNLPLDPAPSPAPAPAEDLTPSGSAEGEKLPDFSVRMTDGRVFTLSDHRGKAVVIDLWATWCAPCVREMRYFEKLRETRPEDVVVLAVHSDLVTEDVDRFLSEKGWALDFAVDSDGAVASLVGAGTMLPHTVVLDRAGKVIYNRPGSVDMEMLDILARTALGETGLRPMKSP